MKRLVRFFFCCAAIAAVGESGVALAAQAAAGGRAVLAPLKRVDALKLAERITMTRMPTWKETANEVVDPFYRPSVVTETKPVEVDPNEGRLVRSDFEILETAANTSINPTGSMMVDGENYLLVGGRRYKSGAQLSVTIDGQAYLITISAIEGKSYTLRLNEQELLRQLK